MTQENNSRRLEEAWLQAVEQAAETESAESKLDENYLTSATGLRVKANVHAGNRIMVVYTPSNCCTVNEGCQ